MFFVCFFSLSLRIPSLSTCLLPRRGSHRLPGHLSGPSQVMHPSREDHHHRPPWVRNPGWSFQEQVILKIKQGCTFFGRKKVKKKKKEKALDVDSPRPHRSAYRSGERVRLCFKSFHECTGGVAAAPGRNQPKFWATGIKTGSLSAHNTAATSAALSRLHHLLAARLACGTTAR